VERCRLPRDWRRVLHYSYRTCHSGTYCEEQVVVMRQYWMALFFLAGVWNLGPSLRKCKIRSGILEVSSLRTQASRHLFMSCQESIVRSPVAIADHLAVASHTAVPQHTHPARILHIHFKKSLQEFMHVVQEYLHPRAAAVVPEWKDLDYDGSIWLRSYSGLS
jgi:hypothetical protein